MQELKSIEKAINKDWMRFMLQIKNKFLLIFAVLSSAGLWGALSERELQELLLVAEDMQENNLLDCASCRGVKQKLGEFKQNRCDKNEEACINSFLALMESVLVHQDHLKIFTEMQELLSKHENPSYRQHLETKISQAQKELAKSLATIQKKLAETIALLREELNKLGALQQPTSLSSSAIASSSQPTEPASAGPSGPVARQESLTNVTESGEAEASRRIGSEPIGPVLSQEAEMGSSSTMAYSQEVVARTLAAVVQDSLGTAPSSLPAPPAPPSPTAVQTSAGLSVEESSARTGAKIPKITPPPASSSKRSAAILAQRSPTVPPPASQAVAVPAVLRQANPAVEAPAKLDAEEATVKKSETERLIIGPEALAQKPKSTKISGNPILRAASTASDKTFVATSSRAKTLSSQKYSRLPEPQSEAEVVDERDLPEAGTPSSSSPQAITPPRSSSSSPAPAEVPTQPRAYPPAPSSSSSQFARPAQSSRRKLAPPRPTASQVATGPGVPTKLRAYPPAPSSSCWLAQQQPQPYFRGTQQSNAAVADQSPFNEKEAERFSSNLKISNGGETHPPAGQPALPPAGQPSTSSASTAPIAPVAVPQPSLFGSNPALAYGASFGVIAIALLVAKKLFDAGKSLFAQKPKKAKKRVRFADSSSHSTANQITAAPQRIPARRPIVRQASIAGQRKPIVTALL